MKKVRLIFTLISIKGISFNRDPIKGGEKWMGFPDLRSGEKL